MATRVKAQRKKGEIVTPFDVYIGRRCTQGGWNLQTSKWANPYVVGKDGTREEVLEKYVKHLLINSDLLLELEELRGKTIACFCSTEEDCHGDILINFLNKNLVFKIV